MEILNILTESAKNLYPEDLDFFETELATGEEYSEEYKEQCRAKIQELRMWMNGDSDDDTPAKSDGGSEVKPAAGAAKKSIFVDIRKLSPTAVIPAAEAITPLKRIEKELKAMREQNSYKSMFKNYIENSTEIDEAFIEAHYSLFQPWEMDAIVSVKQLSEEFLEKYFATLDHDKIARYQRFSENFFMKHFAQLDASVVLEQGKNEWRKKENRSTQLDVFLRLKGVKI